MPIAGHQRNASAGQQLIVDSAVDDEEAGIGTSCGDLGIPVYDAGGLTLPAAAADGRRGTAPSTGRSGAEISWRTRCKDEQLRANYRVVLGSVALTIIGSVLLVLGAIVSVAPREDGLQGWVFLFAGSLFFIPGFYHVFYIVCTLCGRPGYAFDNLPTFSRYAR